MVNKLIQRAHIDKAAFIESYLKKIIFLHNNSKITMYECQIDKNCANATKHNSSVKQLKQLAPVNKKF